MSDGYQQEVDVYRAHCRPNSGHEDLSCDAMDHLAVDGDQVYDRDCALSQDQVHALNVLAASPSLAYSSV